MRRTRGVPAASDPPGSPAARELEDPSRASARASTACSEPVRAWRSTASTRAAAAACASMRGRGPPRARADHHRVEIALVAPSSPLIPLVSLRAVKRPGAGTWRGAVGSPASLPHAVDEARLAPPQEEDARATVRVRAAGVHPRPSCCDLAAPAVQHRHLRPRVTSGRTPRPTPPVRDALVARGRPRRRGRAAAGRARGGLRSRPTSPSSAGARAAKHVDPLDQPEPGARRPARRASRHGGRRRRTHGRRRLRPSDPPASTDPRAPAVGAGRGWPGPAAPRAGNEAPARGRLLHRVVSAGARPRLD